MSCDISKINNPRLTVDLKKNPKLTVHLGKTQPKICFPQINTFICIVSSNEMPWYNQYMWCTMTLPPLSWWIYECLHQGTGWVQASGLSPSRKAQKKGLPQQRQVLMKQMSYHWCLSGMHVTWHNCNNPTPLKVEVEPKWLLSNECLKRHSRPRNCGTFQHLTFMTS